MPVTKDSFWKWLLDGAGGVVNMLDAWSAEGVPMTNDQAEQLVKLADRLQRITDKAIQNVENR